MRGVCSQTKPAALCLPACTHTIAQGTHTIAQGSMRDFAFLFPEGTSAAKTMKHLSYRSHKATTGTLVSDGR